MGYSFIPVFLGNVLAGIISGSVYQQMSDKVMIVQKYVAEKGFLIPEGLSNNAYFDEAARQSGMSPRELTDFLWNTYHPSQIWMVLMAIGVGAAFALFVYDRVTSRSDG